MFSFVVIIDTNYENMSRTEAFERIDFFGRALADCEKRKVSLPCVDMRCAEMFGDLKEIIGKLRRELREGELFVLFITNSRK